MARSEKAHIKSEWTHRSEGPTGSTFEISGLTDNPILNLKANNRVSGCWW